MSESLARKYVHVHELSPAETLPEAANDNAAETIVTPPFVAANDNEALDTEELMLLQKKLGILKEEARTDSAESPEEIPNTAPEEIGNTTPTPEGEIMPGHAEAEDEGIEPEEAQAAGGAERTERSSGDDGGEGWGESSNAEEPRAVKKSRFSGFFKKLLIAPFWIIGAAFALGMTAIIKITNKIFEKTKLSKGGEGKSGGSGSH